MKTKGFWALVLHAHLPYVRHPEMPEYLEERWLFEALTECYLPLTDTWLRLREEKVDFRLTLSVSPPLAAMLADPLLQDRYLRHLDKLLLLAAQEEKRTHEDLDFAPLATMYREKLERARSIYRDQWGCQLAEAWKSLVRSGHLDLWTSAATHAFLPYTTEASWRPQICTGVQQHHRIFGTLPHGIWLPECGYVPGMERVLVQEGLKCFVVDTGAFSRAHPAPANLYRPLHIGEGVAAFARDPETSQQVWDKKVGYPGDWDYREFYRDIGFDLPYEQVAPFLGGGDRGDTGFKYYRITGDTDQKQPYRPDWVAGKVNHHADNFVFNRRVQVNFLQERMDHPPIVVSPYDAELFGHWWYEGPAFLEAVLRKMAAAPPEIGSSTPRRYMDEFGTGPDGRIFFSTWGENGFGKVWVNPKNDWIYRHLHLAEKEMVALAEAWPKAEGEALRGLNQAARELMLAQSSDWAFIMHTGTTVEYAIRRTEEHLDLFWKLAKSLRNGNVDLSALAHAEWRHPLFPELNYRTYVNLRELPPSWKQPSWKQPLWKQSAESNRRSRGRLGPVWMLTWEYPPRVMGGLGRHVADLSQALVAQGIPVRVFTCAVPGSPEREVVDGVDINRLPVSGGPANDDFLGWVWRFNFSLLAGVMAEAGVEIPAVVHAHDWLVAMAAKEIQRLLGIPLVGTIHATEHGRQHGIHNDMQRYIHNVEAELVSIADEVIACSDYMLKEVSTLFAPLASKLTTIPNGVNPANVQTVEGKGRSIASEEFVYPGGEVILYIGRLVAEKGVQVLVEALPVLLARRPRARVLIAGRGPMEGQLRERAMNLGVAERVTFTGFVEDETRNRLLSTADVAVFPSLYEPFGIVALEAMAAQVPVVVGDTGGFAEIVQNGINGVKVPPGDPVSLAGAITRVLEDRKWAEQMVGRARQEVDEIYAWGAIAGRTAEVYDKAVDKGNASGFSLLNNCDMAG